LAERALANYEIWFEISNGILLSFLLYLLKESNSIKL